MGRSSLLAIPSTCVALGRKVVSVCFFCFFFSPFPIGLLVLLLTEGFDQNGACDAVGVLSVCVGELDFDFAHGMRGG